MDRKRGAKLPIVLSVTALLVAMLGFTPIGEAGRNLVFPKNSIGSNQIKPGGVKRSDIADRAVNSAKLADNSVSSLDITDGSILSGDIASGVIPATFAGAAAGGDLAGTYPNPTIKDGAVTAAKHAVVPTVRATHNVAQTIPTGGGFTAVAFNGESFDSANLHDNTTNNSRITITTPGIYLVGGNVTWAPAVGGAREINIRKNGTVLVARVVQLDGGINSVDQELATLVKLVAGDFLEVVVRQTSGAGLDILTTLPTNEFSPIFWADWQGPAPA